MKLMDRYMLREMIVPFLIGQCAIICILVGTMLYNNANILIQNQVPVVLVVRIVLFFLPFLVHMTMPVAIAVGTALAVSRLVRDSEITVLRSAGVGMGRIFLPYFVLGLLLSVGDFYFGEYVVPPSIQKLNEVFAEIPMHLKRLIPQAGQLVTSGDQSYAIIVREMIPQKGYIQLKDVQLIATVNAVATKTSAPFIVYAANGKYINGDWELDKPHMVMWKESNLTESRPQSTTRFKLHTVVDPQAFQTGLVLQFPMWQFGQNSAIRTFKELGETIERDRKDNITNYLTLMDYHFKLSVPFSCLVMAICCPPMAHRFGRAGGFMGVLLSIFLVFFYWNTMLLMRILGSPGMEGRPPYIPPYVAAWLQNVLFVLAGIFMLKRSE